MRGCLITFLIIIFSPCFLIMCALNDTVTYDEKEYEREGVIIETYQEPNQYGNVISYIKIAVDNKEITRRVDSSVYIKYSVGDRIRVKYIESYNGKKELLRSDYHPVF